MAISTYTFISSLLKTHMPVRSILLIISAIMKLYHLEKVADPVTPTTCKSTIVITIIVFALCLSTQLLIRRKINHLPNYYFTFSQNPKAKDTPFCVVCLHDAMHGEKLRRLPRCNHCFHLVCIDAWLQSHSTCPLCRNRVFLVQQHPPAPFFFFFSILHTIFSKLGNFHLSFTFGDSSFIF